MRLAGSHVNTLIHQRVNDCRAGRYPKAICRLSSGWVVLGDVQFVRGYSLLLPDPVVADLNELSGQARTTFLSDMAAVGDAVVVDHRGHLHLDPGGGGSRRRRAEGDRGGDDRREDHRHEEHMTDR